MLERAIGWLAFKRTKKSLSNRATPAAFDILEALPTTGFYYQLRSSLSPGLFGNVLSPFTAIRPLVMELVGVFPPWDELGVLSWIVLEGGWCSVLPAMGGGCAKEV